MAVSFIRNSFFVFLVFITSFLGSLFILFPLLPLLLVNRPVWRRVVDQIIGLWLCLPVALMEWLMRIQFRVTGDRMCSTEKAVIIMNHRTRLDWLFLWSALYRMDAWLLTSEKILLKKQLRKILGAGWAMECNNFMFLERSLEKDSVVLREGARYLTSTGNAYQILIFPEGTDLCPSTIVKSDSYAQSHCLPIYKNVLHPRTNGFLLLVQELRRNAGVNFIYDFTIAFPDEIVQTEIDLATTGQCPKRVEFHCRRYRIEDILPGIATDENEEESNALLNNWCQRMWQRKEEELDRYYDSKHNNNNKKDERISLYEACCEEGREAAGKAVSTYEISGLGKFMLALALTYWLASVSFWLYALWAFWWLKYYAIAGVAVFKVIEYLYLGVERFEIALWKRE